MKKVNGFDSRKLKVALIHDYLVAFGGGERVLIALHEIWPEAPVYLSAVDFKRLGEQRSLFKGWRFKTSWFNRIPGASRLISPLRFLLPFIWRGFDFSGYDLVITSSAWAMPRLIDKKQALHFCYCHTPPRFLYHYPQARRWTRYWPVKAYAALVNHWLRYWDYLSAQKVDLFIANSREVAGRIKKFYRRDSVVIPPPIEIRRVKGRLKRKDFYLSAGRLVSYKHPELAIKACQQLKRRLVVVGDGPLRSEVEGLAKGDPDIIYLGPVSDQKLWRLYSQCRAFIYPVEEEDFGMMSLEAASCGTPVIGLFSGGIKETVIEGKTGIFFQEPTVKSLAQAIKRFEKMSFSPMVCRKWAENFSKETFKRKVRDLVDSRLKKA